MRITEKDVIYVADLANLELTDQERRRMVKDLDSILTYIDRLNELNTDNVAPMAQVVGPESGGLTKANAQAGKDAWREDVLRPSLPHKDAMANAPTTDGDFFKVPKVIER
jgi:aspartyl-tRNA(Asn)/glutamyl-tRNA(Gln) amidotransferase subunit C